MSHSSNFPSASVAVGFIADVKGGVLVVQIDNEDDVDEVEDMIGVGDVVSSAGIFGVWNNFIHLVSLFT